MEMVLALAAFVVLDVLALEFGADSRDAQSDEVLRMEHDAARTAWRA